MTYALGLIWKCNYAWKAKVRKDDVTGKMTWPFENKTANTFQINEKSIIKGIKNKLDHNYNFLQV